MEDNSHAGQGPVVLDIGGTIGAVVVAMPQDMLGVEIEIAPAGQRPTGHHHAHDAHTHSHDGHDHGTAHSHGPRHLVHVGVVARPGDGGRGPLVATAIFGEVEEGDYELYERPDGPTRLHATVVGGQVTQLRWPSD